MYINPDMDVTRCVWLGTKMLLNQFDHLRSGIVNRYYSMFWVTLDILKDYTMLASHLSVVVVVVDHCAFWLGLNVTLFWTKPQLASHGVVLV